MRIFHKMMISHILAISLAILSNHAQASYIGASATLTFEASSLDPVTFSSPATVGPGTEFTGGARDIFGQDWTFVVDVFQTGVVIKMSSTGWGNISSSNQNAFIFDLSFSDTLVGDLALISYSNIHGWESGLTSVTTTSPNSIRFGFNGLYDTAEYTFINAAEIPEPASIALLGLGFAGLAGLRRTRRKDAVELT